MKTLKFYYSSGGCMDKTNPRPFCLEMKNILDESAYTYEMHDTNLTDNYYFLVGINGECYTPSLIIIDEDDEIISCPVEILTSIPDNSDVINWLNSNML